MINSRRNEAARSRRRNNMKKKTSLTSLPMSEIASHMSSPGRKLNINNNFGWTVLTKTQVGDGVFPHLTQYYEKPNIPGTDFQKVTYVLYMDNGTVIEKNTALKQTQTGDSAFTVRKEKSEEKPKVIMSDVDTKKSDTKKHEKKRKLISEFYYVPRDRSRSARRSKSRDKYKAGEPDVANQLKQKASPRSQPSEFEHIVDFEDEKRSALDEFEKEKDNTLREIDKEREEAKKRARQEADKQKDDAKDKIRKEMEKRKKHGYDRWTLRAGADSTARSSDSLISDAELRKPSSMVKPSSKVIHTFKYKREGSPELLATPSGTNKYLYMSKGRSRKREVRRGEESKQSLQSTTSGSLC